MPSKMKTNKIVLIRHGESNFNKQNLFCSWHDDDLSDKGREDALKVSAASLIEHNMQFDCAFGSVLKRTHESLEVILKAIKNPEIPVQYDWRLNERHYGNLIGFNKRQMADRYGEEQVQIWRRSFDIPPPPISPDNPYYDEIKNNPKFKVIPPNLDCESLKTVMERAIPFWEEEIMERVMRGERILIVGHGTSLRALRKYLENISDADISKVNVPNSIPFVYEFDIEERKLLGKAKFLADENFLNKEMEKVASIGK